MYSQRRRTPLCKEEKTELEQAQDNLEVMRGLEECKRKDMYTIVLSNGTCISSTNLEQLNEYESRYARMGVKVKRRY